MKPARIAVFCLALATLLQLFAAASHDPSDAALPGQAIKGTVKFQLCGPQDCIPEAYRLEPHEFEFSLTLRRSLPGIGVDLYDLQFPSPVVTETPQNNTVIGEYYRPIGAGPFPGVVVLDILGGDQTLGRLQASMFAQNGVAALFVQMAYYGPRRPHGSKLRLVSPDVDHSLKAVRQTILDVRRAAAWLATRDEIDTERLGICGTSLGSFMGSLAAQMEPRLRRVAIVLGGGGLVDAFYDHPHAQALRTLYEVMGGSKEQLAARLAPIDPLTCAENLKDRKVIMVGAERDEVVPPTATRRLWEALGRPRILWYDTTHTGAIAYLGPALKEVVKHFKE